jgi:hypothetical protein
MLTEEEQQAIALAMLYCREQRGLPGATEAELLQAIQWAAKARMDMALLDGILTGHLLVDVQNGGLQFMVTDKGKALAKPMADRLARERGLPPLHADDNDKE